MSQSTQVTEPSQERKKTIEAQRVNPSQSFLLEPQFYPDPAVFRTSLGKLTQDDLELMRNITCNKDMVRVLAPYLRIMRKEKRHLWEKTRSRRGKRKQSRDIFKKTSKQQSISVLDLSDKNEMIVSIHETADVLKSLLNANVVVSYLVNPLRNELYQSPRHVDSSTSSLTWTVELGTTIAAYAAFTRRHVSTDNVSNDPRFPLGLGFTNTAMKYALCIPVKTPDDRVALVYEIVRDAFKVQFDAKDVQNVLAVTSWMGVAIQQNSLYTSSVRQQELTNYLIQLTNYYHSGQAEVNSTLSDVAIFARESIGAERCNLFVVEKQLNKVLTVTQYDQGSDVSRVLFKRRTKKYITQDGGLLGKVMIDGEAVKSQNEITEIPQEGELFVRSVLCVPIVSNEETLGALQLTNKKGETEFSVEDKSMLQTFATFCAINLNHLKSRERERKSVLNNKVITEMLLHHIQPCVHVQDAVKSSSQDFPEKFFTLSWYPSPDQMPKILEYTINMFREVLGDSIMALNNVPKFVLTVQNCYRPNPYHNFQHAFLVGHMMANILTRYSKIFTGIEKKGLLVAAVCHDVDHRGYNNNFLRLTKHYLDPLYGSSPLENHHFAVTKLILHQCKMFIYLKPDVYNELIAEIYEDIIATDLSLYFQIRAELLTVADQRNFTFENTSHRRLVKSLLMTLCDLCGQTKALPISKKITEDLYEEFFQQGDIEKKMGFIPLSTMDRDDSNMLAENQVQFLSIVVLPCVEILCRIFNMLSPILWETKILLNQWKEFVTTKSQKVWKPHESAP